VIAHLARPQARVTTRRHPAYAGSKVTGEQFLLISAVGALASRRENT
jgi:hypothetical protein